MKKLAAVLVIVLCCQFFTGIEGYAADPAGDSVTIVSVTPDAVMDYSRPVTFSVGVEYSLSSADEANVYIAFNTTKPDVFTIYDQTAVQAGTGTVTLSTTITPVGWGTSYAPKGYVGNLVDSLIGRRFQVKAALATAEQLADGTLLAEQSRDINHGKPSVELELDSLIQTVPSAEYDPTLALMLMELSDKAYQDEEGITETYIQMGFPREDIGGEYTEKPRFDWDSAKFTVGRKFLPSGDQMVLIAVRGTEGELLSASPDWVSNFYMGSAYSEIAWHQGFKSAAYEVYNYLKDEYFGGDVPTSHVKYVLTGHSRGGAVANLVSVLLMEDGVAREDLYDYNFACPDVARDLAGNWNPQGKYDNIFNIGNCSDPVTHLPGVVGDALPLALDYFVDTDKWYGKVIDALNQTSVEQVYTSWGKYGRSYWFSENWNYTPGLLPDFSTHDQTYYLTYLAKRLPLSEMKTWAEATDARLAYGPSQALHTISGIFLCPVDVVFKDPDGNILASVKDGELEFVAAGDCCAVILTDGDRKIVSIQSAKEIEVELLGTDNGTMSMVLMKGDAAGTGYSDAVAYENIKLKKGKVVQAAVDPEEALEAVRVVTLDKKGEARAEIRMDGKEIRVNGSGGFLETAAGYWWVLAATAVAAVAVVLAVKAARKKKSAADVFTVDALPPVGNGAKDDEIICACGAVNPTWAKKCIMCGKKLKKRR